MSAFWEANRYEIFSWKLKLALYKYLKISFVFFFKWLNQWLSCVYKLTYHHISLNLSNSLVALT